MTDTIRKRTVNRAAETKRKSAERQRRREAGEVRVEVWLDAQTLAQVDKYARIVGCNRQEMIIKALKVWK